MREKTIIEADLTWVDGTFEPNVQVVIENDTIRQVGYLDLQPTIRLPKRALLPGMVNTHSHAFQRGLRGFGEQFPRPEDSMWTWRPAMHELVELLDRDEFRNLTRMAYEEMLRSGITSVGEFHYFHHDDTGQGYELDRIVLETAQKAGIRIVLLCTFYAHGGIDKPLAPALRRFQTTDINSFTAQVDRLRALVDNDRQRIGIAIHNIRAATPDEIVQLHQYATKNDLVFHIRVEESPREVEECQRAYGQPPIELLADHGILGPNTTLIHCTQTKPETLRRIAKSGANVCLCPTTEANLGDGIADVNTLFEAGGKIALGTDSNARISMNEEMRWLEYVERIRHKRRGVLVDKSGRTANRLYECATTAGARSLGLPVGDIAPGKPADFLAVDTSGLSLLGGTRESLLAGFVLGADRACITHTCVGGTWHEWNG